MPSPARPQRLALGLVLTGTLTLAACGGSDTPGSTTGDEGTPAGGLSVVTSTDVYGSIAEQVAGDLLGQGVEVTAIIDDPNLDPHSYEATARDQLALSRATVVVENGGGYDPFIETMLGSSDAQPVVVDAVELSGKEPAADASTPSATTEEHDHDHGSADHEGEDHADHGDGHAGHDHVEGLNEHVFYDLATASKVAEAIATALGEKDPSQAATFTANAAAFADKIDALQQQATAAQQTVGGKDVVVTEPVPDYLLEAMGVNDVTPPEFSEGVEEGTDVPATVLAQTLDLVSGGTAKAVVYNEQTSGAQTDQVQQAATAAGVPVVPVTETLPAGKTYEEWMRDNITAITDALG
ncbi:metal ABC transporter solute-binding protein, Zn/Mn family [Kineococcus gynurae]|uniref:Metal ABC transporter solute-binding protein, Zn/Mn family n=1 Tax=Kineococcus gynurae TaxID=452979 RepID=A0ABV5LSM6_9ACTN